MLLAEIEPKLGRIFDATNLRKEWQKACTACELGRIIGVPGKKYDPRYEGLTIHDLRRSAGSEFGPGRGSRNHRYEEQRAQNS